MPKKSIKLPTEEGILWLPKKDPAKKKKVDSITGKRLGQYGKMPRSVTFFEQTPEGWDNRSWRLQIYSFLQKAAENVNTTPTHMLKNMGYDANANKSWVYAMKKDKDKYRTIRMDMIVNIARMTNTPFTIY